VLHGCALQFGLSGVCSLSDILSGYNLQNRQKADKPGRAVLLFGL
jgi:hypothetical protein